MIYVIDHNDSFTHNVVHQFSLYDEVECDNYNNLDKTKLRKAKVIVLSPGPGLPNEAGRLEEITKYFLGRVPVFGVCLGMQAIAENIGGTLHNQSEIKHGVQERIILRDSILYKSLPREINVGLYHSWAVNIEGVVNAKVTSVSDSGVVMSFENFDKKFYGVQFHPESILTTCGMEIVKNFIEII